MTAADLVAEIGSLFGTLDGILRGHTAEALVALARAAGSEAELGTVVGALTGALDELDAHLARLEAPLRQLDGLAGLIRLTRIVVDGMTRLIAATDDSLAGLGLSAAAVGASPLAALTELGTRVLDHGDAALAGIPTPDQLAELRAHVASTRRTLRDLAPLARGAA